MNGTIIYFVFGGIIFIFIFTIILYIIRKLKKIFQKKYIPETATSFKCLDGHIVRSKGELIVDNFLYNNNISHEYEKTININGNSIKYDWFLPDHEIYIEYWGYYGKDYMKRKEKKIKLYQKGKLNLISIEDIMFKDIYHNLGGVLRSYIKTMNSEKHCPNCGIILDDRF